MDITWKLHQRISLVCPIDGVSIGRKDDKSTWRIDFRPEATSKQRIFAKNICDIFDIAAEESKPKPLTLEERIKILEQKLGL